MNILEFSNNHRASQIAWRELLHDALHSQSALINGHNYVEDFDDCPALLIYDQLTPAKERGMVLRFAPMSMSAYDWDCRGPAMFVGSTFYTPMAPSKFLKSVVRSFVAPLQPVDFGQLRSYLAEVDRRHKEATIENPTRRNKASRRSTSNGRKHPAAVIDR